MRSRHQSSSTPCRFVLSPTGHQGRHQRRPARPPPPPSIGGSSPWSSSPDLHLRRDTCSLVLQWALLQASARGVRLIGILKETGQRPFTAHTRTHLSLVPTRTQHDSPFLRGGRRYRQPADFKPHERGKRYIRSSLCGKHCSSW